MTGPIKFPYFHTICLTEGTGYIGIIEKRDEGLVGVFIDQVGDWPEEEKRKLDALLKNAGQWETDETWSSSPRKICELRLRARSLRSAIREVEAVLQEFEQPGHIWHLFALDEPPDLLNMALVIQERNVWPPRFTLEKPYSKALIASYAKTLRRSPLVRRVKLQRQDLHFQLTNEAATSWEESLQTVVDLLPTD